MARRNRVWSRLTHNWIARYWYSDYIWPPWSQRSQKPLCVVYSDGIFVFRKPNSCRVPSFCSQISHNDTKIFFHSGCSHELPSDPFGSIRFRCVHHFNWHCFLHIENYVNFQVQNAGWFCDKLCKLIVVNTSGLENCTWFSRDTR